MNIAPSQLGGGTAVAGNLHHLGHSLSKAHEDDLLSVWSTGRNVIILDVADLFQITRIQVKAPQIQGIVVDISGQYRDVARAAGGDGGIQGVLAQQRNPAASVGSCDVSVS